MADQLTPDSYMQSLTPDSYMQAQKSAPAPPLKATQYGPLAKLLGQDHESAPDPKDQESRDAVEKFKNDHPNVYGTLKALFNDATPMPVPGMSVAGAVEDSLAAGSRGAIKGLIKGMAEGAHKLPIIGKTIEAFETPFQRAAEGWKAATGGAGEVAPTGAAPVATAPVAAPAPAALPTPAPVAAPAVDTAALDEIAGSLAKGKKFSQLGPAGQETVRMLADKMKAQAAKVVEMPSPVNTSAVPVQAAPEPVTIPFSKETPSAESFKAAARADRAPKVELIARQLADKGFELEQIDAIQPGQWRDIADSLKIDLPKSLDSTIRDIKLRVGELKSNRTTFTPSPALQEALKKPGAMEAARKLAEAMK